MDVDGVLFVGDLPLFSSDHVTQPIPVVGVSVPFPVGVHLPVCGRVISASIDLASPGST